MSKPIALIPARGGSQRVPRKNVRDFLGRPIIARVIQTLLTSGTVEQVVVSTDDAEIAEVAREAGATTPFVRPDSLADSFTGARPVIQHAVTELALPHDSVMGVFYATAVFMTADDVKGSLALLDEAEVDFVMGAAEFPAPIERAFSVDHQGQVHVRESAHIATRSQDLAPAYYDVGQFYWGRAGSWLTPIPVVAARTRAYVLDSRRVVDIDTVDDWARAEALFKVLDGEQ